jgi:hypothetical protein
MLPRHLEARNLARSCASGGISINSETPLLKNLLLPVSIAVLAAPLFLLAGSKASLAQSVSPVASDGNAKSFSAGVEAAEASETIAPVNVQSVNSSLLASSISSEIPFRDQDDLELALSSDPSASPAPSAYMALDPAPDPSGADGQKLPGHFGERPKDEGVVPAGYRNLAPFSKVGIGFGISPLGIGIKGAIDVDQHFDLRAIGSFFDFTSPSFDISGFTVNTQVNLSSLMAALDWYPFGSGFRLSPGVLLFNNNRASGSAQIAPGTSFTIAGETYYAANPSTATGTTPLMIAAKLGLNTYQPAITLTAGFGSFVPRSRKHWSFPSEFGVAYTGAPTISLLPTGYVCTNKQETVCSNVSDTSNPVGLAFQQSIQTQLARYRRDLSVVKFYPIFSSSVVYSFSFR